MPARILRIHHAMEVMKKRTEKIKKAGRHPEPGVGGV